MKMKKRFLLMLAMLLALCTATALADTVPEEIEALFDVPAWEGYQVARSNTEGEGYACFLADEGVIIDGEPLGMVIVQKGEHNVLCVLQKRSGQWRITGRNHNAVPDGDIIPTIHFDLQNDIDLVYSNFPVRDIYTISLKYDGRKVLFDGMVYGAEGGPSYDSVIRDGSIVYHVYEDLAYEGSRTVYGIYDASFEAFNHRYFPKTPEEADAILTVAPVIPKNQGDPNALRSPVEMNLRTGEKYDVFSAPGRDSYRPAGGKAVMSTNDWVQIFGEENGWVLVQYDISSGQMRFGYVDASVLPRNASVRQLYWANIPYTVTDATWLTDDPLNSCKKLATLNAGEEVTCLATMGDWLYVETEISGMAARGFIPVEAAAPSEPAEGWDTLQPNG